MNARLERFLAAENITQSQFADTIGVARAGVSHIISGRNKPGFDFIENMARHYPSLNLEWLITGNGKMYKDTSRIEVQPAENVLFADGAVAGTPVSDIEISKPDKAETKDIVARKTDRKKTIVKLVAFYSDNTFEEFYKI